MGITNYTSKAHICRAVLEAAAFQLNDVISEMNDAYLNNNDDNNNKKEGGEEEGGEMKLYVDGGVTNSELFLQILADIINASVICRQNREMTSLGVAYAAALAVDIHLHPRIDDRINGGGEDGDNDGEEGKRKEECGDQKTKTNSKMMMMNGDKLFQSKIDAQKRKRMIRRWKNALRRSLSWANNNNDDNDDE